MCHDKSQLNDFWHPFNHLLWLRYVYDKEVFIFMFVQKYQSSPLFHIYFRKRKEPKLGQAWTKLSLSKTRTKKKQLVRLLCVQWKSFISDSEKLWKLNIYQNCMKETLCRKLIWYQDSHTKDIMVATKWLLWFRKLQLFLAIIV